MVEFTSNDRNLDDLSRFIVTGESGDYIFRQGDPGTEMYIIQEGEIEILKTYGPDTRRLALLEPGDFFGEMSLLEELPRDASARARTDYRLLKIDFSTFDQMVQETPEIAVRMLRKLSRRLRERERADLRATEIAEEVLDMAGQDRTPMKSSSPAPPKKRRARAHLVHDSGSEFPLPQKDSIVIGRVDHVTGFAPDIDFSDVDPQRTLSRRHVKISWLDDALYLREEIGVSNGTFVNGNRIKTGVPVKLEDGDEIRFGTVKTVFRFD